MTRCWPAMVLCCLAACAGEPQAPAYAVERIEALIRSDPKGDAVTGMFDLLKGRLVIFSCGLDADPGRMDAVMWRQRADWAWHDYKRAALAAERPPAITATR